MAIPCPPEVLSPREAFWISLVNRRNQRFLLFDGAAARESRDIIKNPRSPRGKNDSRPSTLLFISFEWLPPANYSSLARRIEGARGERRRLERKRKK